MPWALHLLGDNGKLTAGKNLLANYDEKRDRFEFVSVPANAQVYKSEASADEALKALPELYHTCWKPVELTAREAASLNKEPT